MKYAQVLQYKLAISPEEYGDRWMNPYASSIVDAPGLIHKTWMADFEFGDYACYCVWRDKESMDAYMASAAFAALEAEPFLIDLVVTSMPIRGEVMAGTA